MIPATDGYEITFLCQMRPSGSRLTFGYTLEYWTSMAKKIEEMGADSICIKDMAGLLVPYKAAELIKAMKEVTKLPIQLHTPLYFRCCKHDLPEGSRGRC